MDGAAIQNLIEQGDFDIEWTGSGPEVHFWPGEPFSDIVKTVGLRDLLLRELEVAVPLEFFGNPMNFAPPEQWFHAERVRLLQALLRVYDKWEKRANKRWWPPSTAG